MASAESAATTVTVGILGSTPGTLALARLCESHGLAVSATELTADAGVSAETSARLGSCDLVLDARALAADTRAVALQSLETSLTPGAIIVAAASHRPIGSMGRTLSRSGGFAGLVLSAAFEEQATAEIVRSESTSHETVARLESLLRRIGKKPIVVRDTAGFFAGRVAGAFLNEAMALVGEGVPAALVERSALESGMRAGPLAMLDEMSLKIADEILHQELHDLEHARQGEPHGHEHDNAAPARVAAESHAHEHSPGSTQEHSVSEGRAHDPEAVHDHRHPEVHDHDPHHGHGHDHGQHTHAAPAAASHSHAHQKPHQHAHAVKSKRMPEPAVYVMEKMAHGFRRMGREAGAGFYDYEDDGTVSLWSGLKAFERRAAKVPAEDIRDRLLFIQALEALRCREEGVVGSLADADALLSAYGFPAATGGASGFIIRLGTVAFVRRAEELAGRYGERFLPTPVLVELLSRDEPLEEPLPTPLAGQEKATSAELGSGPGKAAG